MCWKKKDIDELTNFIKQYAVLSNNSNNLMEKLRNISSWNCQHYINKKIAEITTNGINVQSNKSSTSIFGSINPANFLTTNGDEIKNNNVKLLRDSSIYIDDYNNNIPNNISINDYLKNNILTDLNNVKHIFKIEIKGLRSHNNGGYDSTDYLYIYINESSESIILYKTYNTEQNILDRNTTGWFTVSKINKSIKKYNVPENISNGKIQEQVNGGYKKSSKFKTKEVLGKLRRVYRIPNSKKEHIKHKGKLITISEYKKLIKNKR